MKYFVISLREFRESIKPSKFFGYSIGVAALANFDAFLEYGSIVRYLTTFIIGIAHRNDGNNER
jgi:hypothetical protein